MYFRAKLMPYAFLSWKVGQWGDHLSLHVLLGTVSVESCAVSRMHTAGAQVHAWQPRQVLFLLCMGAERVPWHCHPLDWPDCVLWGWLWRGCWGAGAGQGRAVAPRCHRGLLGRRAVSGQRAGSSQADAEVLTVFSLVLSFLPKV